MQQAQALLWLPQPAQASQGTRWTSERWAVLKQVT